MAHHDRRAGLLGRASLSPLSLLPECLVGSARPPHLILLRSMTPLRSFIEHLISEALGAPEFEERKAQVRRLFTTTISPKAAWLEKLCREEPLSDYLPFQRWLDRQLSKKGTSILRDQAWFTPLPEAYDHQKLGLPMFSAPLELARHLALSIDELRWFSDIHEINSAEGPLHHYRYRWIPKRRGGQRLLMEPKESLKITQRRLLDSLITHMPLHEAAHGFRSRRSIRSFAEIHTQQRVVLRMDLQDFFPSITFARMSGFFRSFGYPTKVAQHLAGLVTHAPPKSVLAQYSSWQKRKRLAERHLPQGSPTSPALANALAYRLDSRLTGLATHAGLCYTRYADDLAFSGERITHAFAQKVSEIAIAEGFLINPRKTQFMKSGGQQKLAGVVVNEHPNISRADFDQLKATLHNCTKHGLSSQNHDCVDHFRETLRGRIAMVQMLNPARGQKLLKIFNQITAQ